MTSKAVADRLTITRAALQVMAKHRDGVGAHLSKELNEYSDPVLEGLERRLRRAAKRLSEADIAHAREQADDPAPRRARDEAEEALRTRLAELRGAVRAAYGEEGVRDAALAGELSLDPDRLAQQARAVAGLLNEETLGAPRGPLIRLDLGGLAEALRAEAEALESGLDEVEAERQEAQETLEARRAALEEWKRIYDGAVSAFCALALVAGLPEVAERIKPTARRRIGRPEPVDRELAGEE